jgi:hypothetical protein
MKCLSVDKLAAYVDGVLEREEIISVEKHLEFCPSCRGVLEVLRREDEFLGSVINYPVLPAGFDEDILKNLQPYKKKKEKTSWKYQFLTVVSIVLAVGLGASMYTGLVENEPNHRAGIQMEGEKEVLYAVEDQGVRLEITEVSASPLKIEVLYEIKPDEEVLERYLDKKNVGHLSEVPRGADFHTPEVTLQSPVGTELPYREVSTEVIQPLRHSVVIKPSDIEQVPDIFNATLDFNKFILEEGNWTVTIPIDITEAKAATKRKDINYGFLFNGFESTIINWRDAPNAKFLNFESEFTEDEMKRMNSVMSQREDKEEMHTFIEPVFNVVTESGDDLVIKGLSSSINGEIFTLEAELSNTIEGSTEYKKLEDGEQLFLEVEGFQIQEPENTQFTLHESEEENSLLFNKNEWNITVVTTEPIGSKKKLTIKGYTTIEHAAGFLGNLTMYHNRESYMESFYGDIVNEEREFIIQVDIPSEMDEYHLDIYSIYKWINHQKKIPLQ